ncbi:WG repeat-containing protein [Paenibacillus mesophilus]|uniref:WG repeat-containing protein n=1 Tax=Paenibacillus mesophilus TaxID=2582849 RepID=UPI0013053060|nr:WG repeat-containing protein [Paenibacillus mesophilus]
MMPAFLFSKSVLNKVIGLTIAAALVWPTSLGAQSGEELRIELNSRPVKPAPVVHDGTAFVPFRSALEQLGLTVEWSEKEKSIQGANDRYRIKLFLGSRQGYVNDKAVTLEHPPELSQGTVFVPLRFIAECVGGSVGWDEETKTIKLMTTDEENLLRAIEQRDVARALNLIGEGAYVNYTNGGKQNVLELAIHNVPELVPELLRAGAVANSRGIDGDYPLHKAVRLGDVKLVEALLTGGADVRAVNASGQTPLQLAQVMAALSRNEDQRIVQLLTDAPTVPLSEELLLPLKKNGLYGYINRLGDWIIAPQYTSADLFHDGLAVIEVNEGSLKLSGYIDWQGNTVIEPVYNMATPFRHGMAAVGVYKNNNIEQWFINKDNERLFPTTYNLVTYFSDNRITVYTGQFLGELTMGYIDLNGREVIPPQYEPNFSMDSGFHEGLAAVSPDRKRWGYIDEDGKTAIPYIYERVGGFSQNRADVKLPSEKLWGYIDRKGQMAIEPAYTATGDFSEGLAGVQVDTDNGPAWGFIDTEGSMVISPRFFDVRMFGEGVAPARLKGKPASGGISIRRGIG